MGVVMACQVVLPVVYGELYPFTIAPMFRDAPRLYCEFRVLDPSGAELPLADFALHRNYDGNPVGFGAGVRPMPTLNEFGVVPDAARLRRVVGRALQLRGEPAYVDVEQSIVGPNDEGGVGVVEVTTYRVNRDGS